MGYHTFLSYSSVDRPFAKRLHADLTERGFRIWWDEQELRSRGRDVATEIRDVIRESGEHFLLLIGGTTLEREYVLEELQLAARECAIVIPLRLSDSPRPLPESLDKLPRRDFGDPARYQDTLEQVVADLRTTAAPLGTLRGDIPKDDSTSESGWLRRNDLLDRLARSVIPGGPTLITSTVPISKLHGMGGIGKSVLAAQFVRECNVRRRFSDGIIWTRVASEERPERILEKIGRNFPGHDPSRYGDEDSACESLRAQLTGRSCLIVLDDVRLFRQLELVRRALPDGSDSHLLVTTRLVGLASGTSREVRVDLPDDADARKLLLRTSGNATVPDPEVVVNIVRKCGRLPLALAMVGSMVRGKPADRWDLALERLENAELEEIAADLTDYEHRGLFAALHASIEDLVPELAERYLDLVVFDGDPIPESVLEIFWGGRRGDVATWIDALVDSSLLGRNEIQCLTLHDLQFDYIRARSGRRGDVIATLHRRLLDAYEKRCRGDWTTLEDDGYILQSLVGHLLAAGRDDDVHRLLWPAVETNAWHDRKRSILGSYLDDVRAGWAAVTNRRDPSAAPPRTALVLQSQYALISASLVGVGRGISGIVLCRAAEEGLAGQDEALTLALGDKYSPRRAQTLARLTKHLTGTSKEIAVREASRILQSQLVERNITSPYDQTFRLVASVVPEATIREILATARHRDSDTVRALLLPRLAELHYKDEALNEARAIRNNDEKARALAEIACFLDADKCRDVLVEAKRTTANGNHIVERLAQCGLLDDALELYREHGGGFDCREALVRRAVTDGASDRALELARTLAWDAFECAVLLADVVPSLAEGERPDVADEAWRHAKADLSIPGNYDENRRQCLALAAVAPHRKDGNAILDRLLHRALDPADPLRREDAFDILAPRLPLPLFERLWNAARHQNDRIAVARARVGIACCLPEPRKAERLIEVLTSVDWREVPEYRVDELVAGLADATPEDTARALKSAFTQDGVAPAVIERLSRYARGSRAPAWSSAPSPSAEESRSVAANDRRAIEARQQNVSSDEEKAVLLARASRFQERGEARRAVTKAIEIALQRVSWDSGLLVKVAEETPNEHCDLALELATKGLAGKNRSRALIPVVNRAAEAGFTNAALDCAESSLDAGRDRAMAFAQIARRVPEPLRQQLLRRALDEAEKDGGLTEAWTRHDLFAFLDRTLWEENSSKIDLKLLLSEFIDGLIDLAKYLSRDRLAEAFELAVDMDGAGRPDSLRSLATRLVALEEGELISLWGQALPRLARRSRADLLADLGALAPVIERLGGTESLDAIDVSIRDAVRWWP